MEEKKSYFQNHPWYINKDRERGNASMLKKFQSDLTQRWIKIDSDYKILEIWFWVWNFAHFCNNIWVKDYYWVDIDDFYINILEEEYKNFSFEKKSFEELNSVTESFDIIFTSHLFEHLDERENQALIQIIHQSLKKWWKWINYMPNADSVINWLSMRYWDITHKKIYNSTSFEQTINNSGNKFEKIIHLNDRPTNFIKRVIHKPFYYITKMYYIWMMQGFPKNYSSNIISILTK